MSRVRIPVRPVIVNYTHEKENLEKGKNLWSAMDNNITYCVLFYWVTTVSSIYLTMGYIVLSSRNWSNVVMNDYSVLEIVRKARLPPTGDLRRTRAWNTMFLFSFPVLDNILYHFSFVIFTVYNLIVVYFR